MCCLTSFSEDVPVFSIDAKKRLIDGGKLASCPNMKALSEGTVKTNLPRASFSNLIFAQDKGELLRRWVSNKENLQASEASIKASRKSALTGTCQRKLIAIKDMPNPPYNYSQ